jgi:phosphoribosyl 1,2-cyclic phosphodiesterase
VRFASLGSGSRGNATLIECGADCLLVDCGFSLKDLALRLRRLERQPEDISAILVTHEHTDHVRGVALLSRRHEIPVLASPGTAAAADLLDLPGFRPINCHQPLALGGLEVHPFPVPHDAREPSQFVFHDGVRRLGLLTDTGSTTAHILRMLGGCDALILECNHDSDLLARGPYPESLKRRVGGGLGHLSNSQAAQLVAAIDTSRLQHIVAAHLSERNNLPTLAAAALAGPLGCDPSWIGIAGQDTGLDWRALA